MLGFKIVVSVRMFHELGLDLMRSIQTYGRTDAAFQTGFERGISRFQVLTTTPGFSKPLTPARAACMLLKLNHS